MTTTISANGKGPKTACRECDTPTNFATCSNCGWAVCGRHARKTIRNGRPNYTCPTCRAQGF